MQDLCISLNLDCLPNPLSPSPGEWQSSQQMTRGGGQLPPPCKQGSNGPGKSGCPRTGLKGFLIFFFLSWFLLLSLDSALYPLLVLQDSWIEHGLCVLPQDHLSSRGCDLISVGLSEAGFLFLLKGHRLQMKPHPWPSIPRPPASLPGTPSPTSG